MAIITGRPRRIFAGAPEVPQWVLDAILAGWKQGEWARVSGTEVDYGLEPTNTFAQAKTTPLRASLGGVTGSYSGGAFATKLGVHGTYIIGPAGGNGFSVGNDVFGWDVETRAWFELWPDYGTNIGNEHGEYPDGSPLLQHLYGYNAYFEDQNEYFHPRSVRDSTAQISTAANAVGTAHALSLTGAPSWSRGGSILELADGRSGWRGPNGGVYIPSIKRYLLNALEVGSPAQSFAATYNPATKQYDAEYPLLVWGQNGQREVWEPEHDRVVVSVFAGDDSIRFRPAQDLNASNTTVVQTGDIPNRIGSGGWAYAPNLGGITYYHHGIGKDVYAIFPTAGNEWEWAKISDDNGALTPTTPSYHPSSGLYNRWQIVTLGPYDIAIHVQHFNGPVWAFRVT